jgi:hypothetical protein
MQTSPNRLQTGLLSARPSTPTASAPASAPINVNLPDDVTVKVTEINQVAEVHEQAFTRELQEEAEAENLKKDVLGRILAARQAHDDEGKAYVPPPVPPAVAEATRLEMEAGRKRIAEHEAAAAHRPRPPVDPREGGSRPVIRPDDYVPNFKQGQVPSNSFRRV